MVSSSATEGCIRKKKKKNQQLGHFRWVFVQLIREQYEYDIFVI